MQDDIENPSAEYWNKYSSLSGLIAAELSKWRAVAVFVVGDQQEGDLFLEGFWSICRKATISAKAALAAAVW